MVLENAGRSRCPMCGAPITIRPDYDECKNCDWTSLNIENVTEARKIGEDRFIPPKRTPYPKERKE
jgi:hypothetical protein